MKSFLIFLLFAILLFVFGCSNKNPLNNSNIDNDHFNIVFNLAVGGNGWEVGHDIIAIPSGGYVITGWTDSYGIGRNDLYLIRINNQGNILWERNFGGFDNNSDDHGDGVTLTPDGNIIACGTTNAFGSGYQTYVVKVDMNGNLIWENHIGTSGYDMQTKVFPVSDGYVIGGNAGINENYFVRKIDFDGNLVWDSVYNIDGQFRCMSSTSDGGFVLGGSTIFKVNQNGVIQWSDPTLGYVEANYYGDIFTIIKSTDGGIIAAGNQVNDTTYRFDAQAVYVVKYSLNGDVHWNNKYEFEGFGGCIVENDNETYSIGYSGPEGELFIATIDSDGNFISTKGTGLYGSPWAMINGQSGYAIAGYTEFNTDSIGSVFIAEIEER